MRPCALLAAGEVLAVHGEVARARAALEEALALAERRQDPTDIAQAFTDLRLGAVYAGEVAEASRLAREALPRWEALGDPDWLAVTLTCLGLAADATGDIAAAATHYADSLRWYGTAGDAQHAGFSHCFLGVAEGKRGDLPRAVAQIQATVRSAVALRNRWLLSVAAQSVVALVGARADPERRARLSGAADALAQATGATPAAAAQDVVGLRERPAQGEEGAGEEAAAYRAGRALPFGAVASLALHLLEEVAQALPQQDSVAESAQQSEPPAQRASQSSLSAREAEVLRLVAAGLSNKAIGRRLFLSPSTVNYHLTSAFNKLAVDTRAQAVAVAAQRGLL